MRAGVAEMNEAESKQWRIEHPEYVSPPSDFLDAVEPELVDGIDLPGSTIDDLVVSHVEMRG